MRIQNQKHLTPRAWFKFYEQMYTAGRFEKDGSAYERMMYYKARS